MEGGNGGEVRRVNVVYFISRLGHVEHPHLIRVHHHSRNGVFLRDVKKWLSDLRGSEMPDAFSWSYKRRYRNGYVWQDLFDDDLITPISDNEYVLKGSEILLHTSPKVHSSYGEKKSWASRNGNQEAEGMRNSVSTDSSRNSTSEIYKESPVFGSWKSAAATTDESAVMNDDDKRVLKNLKPRKSDDSQQISTNKISAEEEGRRTKNGGSGGDSARPSVSSESSKSSTYMRSKSYSSGASHMLRNLITCGGQDIRDAVMVPLRRSTGISSAPWEGEHQHQHQHQQQHNARKSFDEAWSGLKMKETIELCRPKLASSKHSMGPFCSQCGKSFKPEKMHSHMKVCRGMKNSSTISTATSDEKTLSPDNLSTRPRILAARCLNE